MGEWKLPIYQLIEPSRIPGRTIDVGQIQDAAQLLSKTAAAIRTHGPQVEAEWDALAGVYDTPDAPDLFHIMKGTHGVGSLARELADECSRVAGALSALAMVIDTPVKELKALHEEALEFRATIHHGMVDAIVYGGSTYSPTETTQSKLWSEDPMTSHRNSKLIQSVNAAFATLDEAQALAVNEINAVNPSMPDLFRARYSPISLDELNSPGARLPYGEPRTPETCSGENISLTGAQWIADTANGVTTRFGFDIYDGEFSWATAINARASGLMTEVGLLLFASPVTWILQQQLTNARRSPAGLSAPQMVVSEFINRAGDHAAGAVEGFTQWNTWATDPGKASTNVVLNVGSMFTPVGEVTAPMKAMASAKAGALIERVADMGTKVGGPRGEAFAAGVRSTASGVSGALETVHLLRDAPKILLSDLTTALKEHLPVHNSADMTNGASGDVSGSASITPTAAGSDRSDNRSVGATEQKSVGYVRPEQGAGFLRRQAEHAELVHGSIFEADSWPGVESKSDHLEPRREPADDSPDLSMVEPDRGEPGNAGGGTGSGAEALLPQRSEHAEQLHRAIFDTDSWLGTDEGPNPVQLRHESADGEVDPSAGESDRSDVGNAEHANPADPVLTAPHWNPGWLLDGGTIDTSSHYNAEHVQVPVGSSDLQQVNFNTGPGEAVFWSGRTDGVGGDGVAAGVASSQGGSTLEQLLRDRLVAMPEFDPGVSSSVDSWREASLRLAEQAQGDVHAVLGSRMRPGSIWETVEFPALKANPAVTRVYSVDPKSGAVSLLWERAK